VTAVLAVLMALLFRSAVDLWHDVGSVGVPALLVPIAASYHRAGICVPPPRPGASPVSGAVALDGSSRNSCRACTGVSTRSRAHLRGLVVSVGFWRDGPRSAEAPAMV